MEKINTEILVSSLFTIGFDKVDALLYTYTLGQLSLIIRNYNYLNLRIQKQVKNLMIMLIMMVSFLN